MSILLFAIVEKKRYGVTIKRNAPLVGIRDKLEKRGIDIPEGSHMTHKGENIDENQTPASLQLKERATIAFMKRSRPRSKRKREEPEEATEEGKRGEELEARPLRRSRSELNLPLESSTAQKQESAIEPSPELEASTEEIASETLSESTESAGKEAILRRELEKVEELKNDLLDSTLSIAKQTLHAKQLLEETKERRAQVDEELKQIETDRRGWLVLQEEQEQFMKDALAGKNEEIRIMNERIRIMGEDFDTLRSEWNDAMESLETERARHIEELRDADTAHDKELEGVYRDRTEELRQLVEAHEKAKDKIYEDWTEESVRWDQVRNNMSADMQVMQVEITRFRDEESSDFSNLDEGDSFSSITEEAVQTAQSNRVISRDTTFETNTGEMVGGDEEEDGADHTAPDMLDILDSSQ